MHCKGSGLISGITQVYTVDRFSNNICKYICRTAGKLDATREPNKNIMKSDTEKFPSMQQFYDLKY
jgi:hypothetical protein